MKKKTNFLIYPLLLMCMFLLFASSCKKEDTPVDCIDIDGNVYKTVTIGTQVWMAENLKTTKYNDGSAITLVSGTNDWVNLTTHGYCWYNNDAATYKNTYGALYNWYAVNTGKLCPTGWRVPTDTDWKELTDNLDGESIAGGKLKESGTKHWNSPNSKATNETSFTALPGGYRNYDNGVFASVGNYGTWWSSTKFNETSAWRRDLGYNYEYVYRNYDNNLNGFSVRCVKN